MVSGTIIAADMAHHLITFVVVFLAFFMAFLAEKQFRIWWWQRRQDARRESLKTIPRYAYTIKNAATARPCRRCGEMTSDYRGFIDDTAECLRHEGNE